MNFKKKVAVGMSGGVDSSVTALLLKEQGYDVTALFMKNWEEKDSSGTCRSTADYEDVVKVCSQIGIPHYTINFIREYQDLVFSHFLRELKGGFTPNPDILCNREIKFNLFLKKAVELGADFVATGHYAQIKNGKLVRGIDQDKDQTYFLYTLQSQTLDKVLFPIGYLKKKEVRAIARKHNLATAEKKDSTGICFIGERNFAHFLSDYIGYQKGNFETLSGKVVGQHEGIAYYTIGQRKGLRIGGAGEAWFVVGKDVKRNVVFVQQGKNHPALYTSHLTATDISWVSGKSPPLPFHCHAKIRYRQLDQTCLIEKIEGDKISVSFQTPQRAVTSRQSIVFYEGEVCLGGAMIS